MNARQLPTLDRNQLDNGVVTSDGGAGADWMAEYDLEVIKVD